MKKVKIFVVAGAAVMLSSCDLSQIPGLDGRLSLEDSKAVGAACRHSGRALEDCFALNPRSHQAGVFDGWRDMNDYMLTNQIETVKPQIQNSAFKPENAFAGLSAPTSDGASNLSHLADPGDTGVLTQNEKQRWVPRKAPDSESKSASQLSTEPVVSESSNAAREELVPKKQVEEMDAPTRPWERKKESKSHT